MPGSLAIAQPLALSRIGKMGYVSMAFSVSFAESENRQPWGVKGTIHNADAVASSSSSRFAWARGLKVEFVGRV